MAPVHDRMPVIFPHRSQWEAWLEEKEPEAITELLDTPENDILDMYPISTLVNSVRNNGPKLHEPVGEQGDLF
jgi:putative SOS response-associated peptidase YedK